MQAGRGKTKGTAFERTVCKQLSLWVSNSKQQDLFWRTALSGGRATSGRRRGQDIRQSGDIGAVAPEGHVLTDLFYIECKFYANLNFDQFLINGKGKIAEFWLRTVKESRNYNKQPMLIAKQNRFPILVVVRQAVLYKVCTMVPIPLATLRHKSFTVEVHKFDELLLQTFKIK